uniref:Uncharacterized protein n=1 Tax=Candidatus Kentrum sp. TUN TaxID=2126343 RepID=A0A451A888_9GAMM|nr:MAG: hypothetical protein BECKTUN1418D_GA0071000_11708 [Candidatus Kentron sp. TUN]
MNFDNVEEAKVYVCKLTSKAQTIDEIDSSIGYYRKMAENAYDDRGRDLWEDEIRKLELWKNSDDFKQGKYPQGIDELILELIEWRAMIYSFQHVVHTIREPLKESGFFAQWYLGAIYGVFIIIGKLISRDRRDNSLIKLWEDISQIMLDNNACTQDEANYINK